MRFLNIKIRPRARISKPMVYLAPLVAVILTILTGIILFFAMGHEPIKSLFTFFIAPISDIYGISELFVKATPLIIIAIGLSYGFKSNVWNIGAEGQLTIGALFGGGLALLFYDVNSMFLLPGMLILGAVGGIAWAAIPAFLKTRYNTNEILTTLMLTYIGLLFLSLLIHGPMKDPDGMNFPESKLFHDAALLPIIYAETRLHLGFLIALSLIFISWLLLSRHVIGFEMKVIGMAPKAASFAGYNKNRIVWLSFIITGACSGLAGVCEVAGPLGQIVPTISPGYGFTAIIVAFVGRLNPVGILFSGLLVALSYLGGENAQIDLNMPNAVTGVFQGMLLFFLLASDILIRYRVILTSR